MQTVLDQARDLGRNIAEHPRAKSYVEAATAIRADKDARTLLESYERHAEHMRQLEESGKPVEVADKHKLNDLQAKVIGNDNIKNFMRAQADYVDLMNRIHKAMNEAMDALVKSASVAGRADA